MCVHDGGSTSRACLGKFSRKSATLSAQVRACDKTLERPPWLHSYTPVSRIPAAIAARRMINESVALGKKKKERKKTPRQAVDARRSPAFLCDVPQLCPISGPPSLSLQHSAVSNGPGVPLAKGISLTPGHEETILGGAPEYIHFLYLRQFVLHRLPPLIRK